MTETLTGAQILIRLLERQAIDAIAGIPGGHILPIYDALSESTQIRHVLARHEQGAGFIAQGMARATGKAAVCFATSGPGATNLLTAIADAKHDSIPVIAITGQVPSGLIGTDAFQEVDICRLASPITKACYRIAHPAELLEIVPRAFETALSGRPGPVLIDIPKDVQNAFFKFSRWPDPGLRQSAPTADFALIERAAQMIDRASRPILYVGGGAIHSGSSAQIRQLAEKAGLPTALTLMGLGTLPSDHPLALGMLGMHGARATNLAIQQCDLLIAVGARFDDRVTGKLSEFCPEANVIHIDIDPNELNKLKTASVAIAGDAGQVLDLLLPVVQPNARIPWRKHIAELQNRWAWMPSPNMSHFELIKYVANFLDDEAIITTDVGQHQMWVAQRYPLRRPRQWITSGGLGTMGFGVPAGIGAALAEPMRKVVCFAGDGSIMMNIQELITAAEHGVNLKVVVMDNGGLGLVRQQQSLFYKKRIFASQFKYVPDFVQIAKGLGIRAVDLESVKNPLAAIGDSLAVHGPCLIRARVEEAHQVFPMVAPGASNSEMIG